MSPRLKAGLVALPVLVSCIGPEPLSKLPGKVLMLVSTPDAGFAASLYADPPHACPILESDAVATVNGLATPIHGGGCSRGTPTPPTFRGPPLDADAGTLRMVLSDSSETVTMEALNPFVPRSLAFVDPVDGMPDAGSTVVLAWSPSTDRLDGDPDGIWPRVYFVQSSGVSWSLAGTLVGAGRVQIQIPPNYGGYRGTLEVEAAVAVPLVTCDGFSGCDVKAMEIVQQVPIAVR